jgi:DNA-directed RNA polymerase subunit RPC12/RpoP
MLLWTLGDLQERYVPVSELFACGNEENQRRVKAMIVVVLKCQMCGKQFEAELLDRDDPNERHRHGMPIRCPRCNSSEIERIRVLRRLRRTG